MLKEEIQRVLQMNKAGTLTDDQASELLAELMRSERGEGAGEPRSEGAPWTQWGAFREGSAAGSQEDFGESLGAFLSSTIRGLPRWAQAFGGSFADAGGHNTFTMSKVESPRGSGYTLAHNSINGSWVGDWELERAQVVHNGIHASKLKGLRVTEGEFSHVKLFGSSLDRVSVSHSKLTHLRLQGSKLGPVSLTEDSTLGHLSLTGCAVKGVRLCDHSQWEQGSLNGAHVADLELKASMLDTWRGEGMACSDVLLERSRIRNLALRYVRWNQVRIVQSELDDVEMTGGPGWKKQGYDDVRVEYCALSKMQLSECRFQRVVIRNVHLSGLSVHGAELSDVVLDGNEAFQAALKAGQGR
ncbi:MAG TPA: hypothetical protein VL359_10110 [bacterium]|nr:hypothetical protein [bacterium]